MPPRERTRRHGRAAGRRGWVRSDSDLVASAGSSDAEGAPRPHLARVCWVERERVVGRTGGSIVERSRRLSE